MFIGRQEELNSLQSFYDQDGLGLACVYGTIGMGKSALLKEFSKDKSCIYLQCYETTGKHQLELFSKNLENPEIKTAEDFCELIAQKAKTEKVLLILDEYTSLVRADGMIDDVLYTFFNNQWQGMPIKLVFCGSPFILIEKYITGKKAQWSSKLNLTLKVEPFGYYDSCKFFNGFSLEDTVFLYGICGGIPYNLTRVTGSVKETAIKLFLDRENACGLNPEMIMSKELRELAYYNYMLCALGEGLNRVNQISAKVDKPKDVVVPYLNTLMSMDIVTKETAITEITNRKKTRYSIVNTGTLFWYKYIAPNMGLYMDNCPEQLWLIIDKNKKDFLTTVFIKICEENINLKSLGKKMPFDVEAVGNWWENDEEAGTTEGFDLVAIGQGQEKAATAFCQCYYNEDPIEIPQLKALIEKTKKVQHEGDVFYVVFSKAGFSDNAITVSSAIKNIMLISLEDMKEDKS